MTPGHVPIITTRTVQHSNRYRELLWRLRSVVYGDGDAPDLFRNRRPTLTADPRPADSSIDRQGTYPEEYDEATARLIIKIVTRWSAVVILTMILVGVTRYGVIS